MTLQEISDRIIEAWGGISESLEKLAEALRKAFDEANKKIEEHKRLLRRPPKLYAKANKPAVFINRCKVHHCRNNC